MPPTPGPGGPKTLYLIDGHAQFFRAYHAIRTGMRSPVTKEPTNLTFGFVGMLLKVLRQYKPDYLAVVIDASGDRETFRSEIYPEYKATRKETPEDFHPQVERCLQIMQLMRVPVVAIPGVEADDVIATIVRRLQREQPELAIRIVSKDKDLTQLLNHNVELFDVHKDQAVSAAEVFGVEGVQPGHVRDILTLMGDTIDNIPGVSGIGPKTAAQLIIQYGSLDNLLERLDEVKGKKRDNIDAARSVLPVSRQLVTLKEDVSIEFDLTQAQCCPADLPVDALLATFRELSFNRYQDELKAIAGGAEAALGQAARSADSAPSLSAAARGTDTRTSEFQDHLFGQFERAAPAQQARGDYRCIKTLGELDALIKRLRAATSFAIDTETDGLSPIANNLCGVSLSVAPGTGVYVPTRSCEPSSHLTTQQVIEQLRPVLEDPGILKIGHNLKFDINVLRTHGVRLAGPMFDTMIASYVIDATRTSHKMDVLALALLNYTCIPITDLIGSGRKQKGFDQVPLDRAAEYSAEDADITLRLHECLAPRLRELGLERLFTDVEMPLVNVLAELEFNGIRVDPDELERQRAKLVQQIEQLRRRIGEAAPGGLAFNPDSPRQLAAVLFNKPHQDPPGLGIRPLRRGKTGPSTDQEVLEKLAQDPAIDSPLPRLIVEYRQLTKLVNTYLVALKEAINPRSSRVHASFNQTVAATGRLSSSDPNLQNIPIRTDLGREIRRAFIAEPSQQNWLSSASPPGPPGRAGPLQEPNVLLSADYSQIELRLLAHLSQDPALIEAFESGQDIHRAVAAQVYSVQPQDVTPAQRNSAKMVNFGIVYGITAFGLARRLTMGGAATTNEQAATIIAGYKARFSRIDEFLNTCVAMAHDRGYVETILGRRRAVPQVHARSEAERALGERMAINSVVQGSAADLIKVAMIDIQLRIDDARSERTGRDAGPQELARAWMVLQIHDELVFEVPHSGAQAVQQFVVERMQNAMKLRVPLVVESAFSTNWIDAK